MSLWGDDRSDTDVLRPSPAARRPGIRERVTTGRGDWVGTATGSAGGRRTAGAADGRRTGRPRDPDPRPTGAGPDPRPRGRTAVVALVAAAIGVAIAAGPLGLLGSDGGPAPAGTAGRSGPQLPGASGAAALRRAVAVSVTPRPAAAAPCPKAAGIRCTPPADFLVVDEVRGLRAVDRPGGAAVRLALTSWDAATLAAVAGAGGRLQARVGTGAAVPAAVGEGGTLVLALPDRSAAVRAVAALGLTAPPRPRTGGGALDRPLELWTATVGPGPCRVSAAGRGVRVVDRAAECVQLRGPAVTVRAVADLRVARPTGAVTAWVVTLELAPADRPALARLTRALAPGRGRIAFLIGGRVVTGLPVVTREAGGGVDLGVADEAETRLLVRRLRP